MTMTLMRCIREDDDTDGALLALRAAKMCKNFLPRVKIDP